MDLGLTSRLILFYTYSRLLNGKEIGVTELAKIIETSKPNISQIINQLCEIKYVETRPYKPVNLTPNGLIRAEQIYKRVLSIESFLFKTLAIPFFQCRAEAFSWEQNVVYNSTVQAIQSNFHLQIGLVGDPFPTETDEKITAEKFMQLKKVESGRPFKILVIKNMQTVDDIYLPELSKIYLEQATAHHDTTNKTVFIFHKQNKITLPEEIAQRLVIEYIDS